MQTNTPSRYLILLNIRSAYNVGAIFRTADAVGISKIYLVGYTPLPIDRFGRMQQEIHKTALGAETHVPWEHVLGISELLMRLRRDGARIVAVEQGARAVDYKTYTADGTLALIFGNEVEGVPEEVCDSADDIIAIPMYGAKESLNVSVSAGVVLYRLFDR